MGPNQAKETPRLLDGGTRRHHYIPDRTGHFLDQASISLFLLFNFSVIYNLFSLIIYNYGMLSIHRSQDKISMLLDLNVS